jgi:hypothetical protein
MVGGFMIYAVVIFSGGMIHIPSYMKNDLGIQLILRVLLKKIIVCIVDITDGMDLRIDLMRRSQVA